MISLSLDHQVVMSAWEQMGEDHFAEPPLSVPEQFELDLHNVHAGMAAASPSSDFCVPSPSSKGSYASEAFGLPWAVHASAVKQEPHCALLPKIKGDAAAPWQSSMMIPTSNLQPGSSGSSTGAAAGAALPHTSCSGARDPMIRTEKEQPDVGPCVASSPSSSSSQDVAVVPDMRVSSAGPLAAVPATAKPATSSSSATALVPQQPQPQHHHQQQPQQQPLQPLQQQPPAVVKAVQPLQPLHPLQLVQRPAVPVVLRPVPADGEFVRTRAECLERYRQKKARRLYTKKIRYQLRKINADKRPRIKGRFVKKEELDDYVRSKGGKGASAGAGMSGFGQQQCPEQAAFSALAALDLPHQLTHEEGLLDASMFDGGSSDYDDLPDEMGM